jgi:hypothetical protein
MTTYKTRKAAARDAVIMAQQEAAERVQSWEEVAEAADRLERLARRFGLLREFRENGLI